MSKEFMSDRGSEFSDGLTPGSPEPATKAAPIIPDYIARRAANSGFTPEHPMGPVDKHDLLGTNIGPEDIVNRLRTPGIGRRGGMPENLDQLAAQFVGYTNPYKIISEVNGLAGVGEAGKLAILLAIDKLRGGQPYLVFEKIEELLRGIEAQGAEFSDGAASSFANIVNEGLSSNDELRTKLFNLILGRYRFQNINFGMEQKGLELASNHLGNLNGKQNEAILNLAGVTKALELSNQQEVVRQKDGLSNLAKNIDRRMEVAQAILDGKDSVGVLSKKEEYQRLFNGTVDIDALLNSGYMRQLFALDLSLVAVVEKRKTGAAGQIDAGQVDFNNAVNKMFKIGDQTFSDAEKTALKTWWGSLKEEEQRALARLQHETLRAFDKAKQAMNVVGVTGRYDSPVILTGDGLKYLNIYKTLDPVVSYTDTEGQNIQVHLKILPDISMGDIAGDIRTNLGRNGLVALVGSDDVTKKEIEINKGILEASDDDLVKMVRDAIAKAGSRSQAEVMIARLGGTRDQLITLWAVDKIKNGDNAVIKDVKNKYEANKDKTPEELNRDGGNVTATDLDGLDLGYSYRIAMAWDEELRKYFVEHWDDINIPVSLQGSSPTSLKRAYYFPAFIPRTSNADRGRAGGPMWRYAHLNALDLMSYTGRSSIVDQLKNWGDDIGIVLQWSGRLKGADALRGAIVAGGDASVLDSPEALNNPVETLGKLKGKAAYIPPEELRHYVGHWAEGVTSFLHKHNKETFGGKYSNVDSAYIYETYKGLTSRDVIDQGVENELVKRKWGFAGHIKAEIIQFVQRVPWLAAFWEAIRKGASYAGIGSGK